MLAKECLCIKTVYGDLINSTYPFEDQVNVLPMPIAVPSVRDFCRPKDVSHGHTSYFHQLAMI